LKRFREQLKEESRVRGKPLFPLKEHMFAARWKTITDLRTHSGIRISRSGHLMAEDYMQRERQLKILERNVRVKNLEAKLAKVNDGTYTPTELEALADDELELLEQRTN